MGDLGKLIVSKGFKKFPKVQKIAQSGHTESPTLGRYFILDRLNVIINYLLFCCHLYWFFFVVTTIAGRGRRLEQIASILSSLPQKTLTVGGHITVQLFYSLQVGLNQRYWNRRFAIPGFWQMQALHGKQVFPVFPIKWCHAGAQNFSIKVLHFLAPLWCHLMGKNSFPWSAHLPNPGHNPGIANLLFQ